MTILIEAISIVVRCDSLERLGPDGMDRFYSSIPNQTFYSDGSLARVGFMDEQDALGFISVLESLGLVHLQGDESVDFAIVARNREKRRADATRKRNNIKRELVEHRATERKYKQKE